MFSGRCARDLKVWLENEVAAALSNEGWRGSAWRSAGTGRRYCRDCRSWAYILLTGNTGG